MRVVRVGCILDGQTKTKLTVPAANEPRREKRKAIALMDQETFAQRNMEDVEIQEWLESLDSVMESSGPEVAREILERLGAHATGNGIDLPFTANKPYANTNPLLIETIIARD